jgi:predicted dehydrogenase
VTRLGVAGLGWLGESLIKDVPRVAGLEVVAVQDVVADRAAVMADQYGVGWHGQRYEDLLLRGDVDAVLICTPNGLHATQAQSALLAGKDVLVQKPLALSSGDALDTIDVARRTEKLLFVDYTYRFLETMGVFRQALSSVGPARALRATFHNIYGPGAEKTWFFEPSLSGGGALTDLGVHLVDLGLWLIEPRSIRVESVELGDTRPVEHAATLALRLDDIQFEVAVSWNAPLPATEIAFELETAQAVLRWENVDGSFFHFRSLKDGEVLLDRETTLREDTLRAFAAAVATRNGPRIDARVYAILDQAYGRDAHIAAR